MKSNLVLTAGLMLLFFFLMLWSPWKMSHLIRASITIPIGVVLFGIGYGLSALIERKACSIDRKSAMQVYIESNRNFTTPRVLIVSVLSAIGLLIVASFAGFVSESFILGEAIYYLCLLIPGILMARWAKAAGHVPMKVSLLIMLLFSVLLQFSFLTDPSAQYNYGPEIIIFAIMNQIDRIALLPVEIMFVWGSWRVTLAFIQLNAAKGARPANSA